MKKVVDVKQLEVMYLSTDYTLDEVVNKLRRKTGHGKTYCVKALLETNGDPDAAEDLLRKVGLNRFV